MHGFRLFHGRMLLCLGPKPGVEQQAKVTKIKNEFGAFSLEYYSKESLSQTSVWESALSGVVVRFQGCRISVIKCHTVIILPAWATIAVPTFVQKLEHCHSSLVNIGAEFTATKATETNKQITKAQTSSNHVGLTGDSCQSWIGATTIHNFTAMLGTTKEPSLSQQCAPSTLLLTPNVNVLYISLTASASCDASTNQRLNLFFSAPSHHTTGLLPSHCRN